MATQEKVRPEQPEASRRRRPIVALAVGVVAVITLIGVVGYISRPAEIEPANPGEAAIAAAHDWAAALDAGDVEAAVALLDPADEGQAEVMSFIGSHSGGYTMSGCEAFISAEYTTVTCMVDIDDPVMNELGVNELPWSARYTDDGLSINNLGERFVALTAFAGYAQQYETARYDEVCNPRRVDAPTWTGSGVVLTEQCAELWADITNDVVAWIQAGRPTP